MRSFLSLSFLLGLAGCGSSLLATEPVGGAIPNNASVLVDNGKCPAGQVQQVTGPSSLLASRTYACVAKPSGGLF